MKAVLPLLLAAAGCAGRGDTLSRPALGAGASYLAMGSSFAAGPGVMPVEAGSGRCARSEGNYAHLLARKRGFELRDVSCSGATTAHLLGPWNESPAQLDALDARVRLVTVTIGGNDVNYIGGLGAASCVRLGAGASAPGGRCPDRHDADDSAWVALDQGLRRIAAEVHRRAPEARLVFVDYLSLLPPSGTCAATPLSADEAAASRAVANRLAALTERVARKTGSQVLRASALSRGHHACAGDAWTNGFPRPGAPGFVPYHPNARGMAAVADALDRMLPR